MGAWGWETFDNDTACDWAYDLNECNDLSVIEKTLNRVLEQSDGYLDADIASEALAACDVVARLRGNFGVRISHPERVDKWVERHEDLNTDRLLLVAQKAINRITTNASELMDLWKSSDSFDEWIASVSELQSRLK